MKSPVTRRVALSALGASVTALTTASGAEASGPVLAPRVSKPRMDSPVGAHPLLAPLGVGSRLGRWTVQKVDASEGEVLAVLFEDAQGATFQLDVCRRDDSESAARAPGQSRHFSVFVANEGDGSTPTHEDHGLCAMALAEVISGNEGGVSPHTFSTLSQRTAARRPVR